MALSAKQELIYNWLRGSGRTQNKQSVVLSGMTQMLRGGSFRRIAGMTSQALHLNVVSDKDITIATLDALVIPADSPQLLDKDTEVSLPYSYNRIIEDPDNAGYSLKVGGVNQYESVPTVYDIPVAERNAAKSAIAPLVKLDLRKNQLSAENDTANETDFSIMDQMEDIAQLKIEQVVAIMGAAGVAGAISTLKTGLLADIAADEVLASAV